MSDFLLELLCEEIPARMQAKARTDLEQLFLKQLELADLHCDSVTIWSTPRRLALIAHGLPDGTKDSFEEVKGPRVGAPSQALDGFLRKNGLSEDQLVQSDGVWIGKIHKPGRATAAVLAAAIPAIVRAFPWPKSMRWGGASASTESLRWVRPLQGVVALLENDVIPLEIEGISSGRTTAGHRFHGSTSVSISSPATYADDLRAAHVIVDQAERARIIAERAHAAAKDAGYTLIEDAGLVAENAGLTEWPVPLLGHFDPAFLEVPPEVIQLTLRTNQKYFVLRDGSGKLAPAFICTANIDASDGGAAIIAGNGKVLAARLSDARFFWEQDRKTALADHAKKLSRITFHEKLGTVADKVERVAKLARWLVEEGIVKPVSVRVERSRDTGSATTGLSTALDTNGDVAALADMAEQAARLCKADLVTEMVGEFPELQGLMGGYYARAEGLPDAVADAIRDHYKPVGQGDYVPTAPVTVAVSLADKLDTIGRFFSINETPTGSKDPFALRRATLGVLSICQQNGIRIPLNIALAQAMRETPVFRYELQDNIVGEVCFSPNLKIENMSLRDILERVLANSLTGPVGTAWQSLINQIVDMVHNTTAFFADRLKVQQREAGVRHDLIDAVFALGGEDDLVRLLARVHALQSFITTEDGVNLLAAYKRAANILRIAEKDGEDFSAVTSAAADQAEDKALRLALAKAEGDAYEAVQAEEFGKAMSVLASLRAPIDAFFEAVLINDENPEVRRQRLQLLHKFRAAVHKVADFSRIEG